MINLKEGIPAVDISRICRGIDSANYLASKQIRKIRFKKLNDKKLWYNALSGKEMLVILFKGYKDVLPFSMPHLSPIKGEHFQLVKRADKRNSDIRY